MAASFSANSMTLAPRVVAEIHSAGRPSLPTWAPMMDPTRQQRAQLSPLPIIVKRTVSTKFPLELAKQCMTFDKLPGTPGKKINYLIIKIAGLLLIYILSRANEARTPMNRLGSGQRRDTDQGPFSPPTGGLDLIRFT